MMMGLVLLTTPMWAGPSHMLDGFNLVYVPGSTVDLKGYIIRIGTDVGLVGEYAGGSAAENR